MATTTTLMTFEEFERLPDMVGKRELIQGELLEMPPAELTHGRISRRLFKLLDAAVEAAHGRGEALNLGEVYGEIGFQLAKHSWIQPDLSITHAQQAGDKYPEGAPAIAIEVISPSNKVEEMETKADLCFQFGSLELWWVLPKHRRIRIRRVGESQFIRADGILSTQLLPGLALPVAEILK